jgi:metallo-beta-lactamase class B
MFARLAACAAALMLAGTAPAPAPDARTQGKALAAACEGRDGWADAAPPARIFGNTWYVGTCGISVLLVTGPRGHILIDSGPAEAAPSILANIRALGFRPRDVGLIVGSHEHFDHGGGFALLKAATGAKLFVAAPARAAFATGRTDPADPQAGLIDDMAPVSVDGLLKDGVPLKIGPVALTPVATPGHTGGGTSWTWRSCEGARCLNFAYIDSMTPVSRDGYRFTDHPARIAPFRATFTRVAALKCDVLVTPHPGFSNLFERLAGTAPIVYPEACSGLAAAMRQRLEDRLAKERTPPAP